MCAAKFQDVSQLKIEAFCYQTNFGHEGNQWRLHGSLIAKFSKSENVAFRTKVEQIK